MKVETKSRKKEKRETMQTGNQGPEEKGKSTITYLLNLLIAYIKKQKKTKQKPENQDVLSFNEQENMGAEDSIHVKEL